MCCLIHLSPQSPAVCFTNRTPSSCLLNSEVWGGREKRGMFWRHHLPVLVEEDGLILGPKRWDRLSKLVPFPPLAEAAFSASAWAHLLQVQQ